MGEFNQSKYIQEYNKINYKRVPLDIRKEEYDRIKTRADEKGMKVNSYIKDLIRKDIETSGNISIGDITQMGDNNQINIGK